MVLELLMDLVYYLVDLFTIAINVAAFPATLLDVLFEGVSYLGMGLQLLSNYVDTVYLGVLFGLVVAVDAALGVYYFAMWVIQKIPMLGIK